MANLTARPGSNPRVLQQLLEPTVLGDKRIKEMEFVSIAGEGALSLLELRLEFSDRSKWNGGSQWFRIRLGRHNRRKGLGVWRKGSGLEECIRGDDTTAAKQHDH